MCLGTRSPREESNFHETVYGTVALPLCDGGESRAGHGSRTHRGLCGAQTCRYERPAWWCRKGTWFGESPWAAAASGDSHRPALWNRTRTSWVSAKRTNQLCEGGMRAPHARLGPYVRRDYYERHTHVCSGRAAPDHHRHHLRLSESDARRAQGAPRASMCSVSNRAHLSRVDIWTSNQISSCEISCWLASENPDQIVPRTAEGPPGLPGWPFKQSTSVSRQLRGEPPQVPVSPSTRP
jgi:hypothetical protein